MGRPKIKLRTTHEAASYFTARPVTFHPWFKVWLWVLWACRLAKKVTSREYDKRGRPLVELEGYAHKGNLYMTKETRWQY